MKFVSISCSGAILGLSHFHSRFPLRSFLTCREQRQLLGFAQAVLRCKHSWTFHPHTAITFTSQAPIKRSLTATTYDEGGRASGDIAGEEARNEDKGDKRFLRANNNKNTSQEVKSVDPNAAPKDELRRGNLGRDETQLRESLNEMFNLRREHDPREINDKFCARLFATTSFPVPVLIRALEFFGVGVIGPLAFKELAFRSDGHKDLLDQVDSLTAAGTSVRKCVYNDALLSFAKAGENDLLVGLLKSDQHPDVLEDPTKQEELLNFYMSREDWMAVERTSAILSRFHSFPLEGLWNKYLSQVAGDHKYDEVHRIVEQMLKEKIRISYQSTRIICTKLLQPRRQGKRPVAKHSAPRENLNFVINILIRMNSSGQIVDPHLWHEIFHRLYLTGSVLQWEKLCLHLVESYGNRSTEQVEQNRKRTTSRAFRKTHSPLAIIFPRVIRHAAVRLYFRYGLGPGFRPSDSRAWVGGIDLLRRLHLGGVKQSKSELRSLVCSILADLYGPKQACSKYLWKAHARQNNPSSFNEMVGQINNAWGRPLLDETVAKKVVDQIIMIRSRRGVAGWERGHAYASISRENVSENERTNGDDFC